MWGRSIRLLLLATLFVFSLSRFLLSQPPMPLPLDPVVVQRHGLGWKYPQAGWTVLHIEGTPYRRGYQHGHLMAGEIADYILILAKTRSHLDPEAAWKSLRLLTDAAFLRKFDMELLEEMKGIADGAAAAGARFGGRKIDHLDIVALNADVEIGFLESALEATGNGMDHLRFDQPQASRPPAKKREQCSAFAATLPATDASTGGIMLGHITMSDLSWVHHFNVWLDISPLDQAGKASGHRFVCQTFPGGIQSGLDYYISASGLVIAETTIQQTSFDVQGDSEASRIRRCIQFANSIDEATDILSTRNNGLYTNEWLLADTKTNEIAMLELGTRHTKLYRSSKEEWPGGTKGFYWSCNNAKDSEVFSDSIADYRGKPGNLVFSPSSRDVAWLQLFDRWRKRGLLHSQFGFEAFKTPPIVGYPSCDAKFTTTTLAKNLQSWGMFGPPLGRAWMPSVEELAALPDVKPLVANEWTLLRSDDPASLIDSQLEPKASDNVDPIKVVDRFQSSSESSQSSIQFSQKHPFAWRGTLRPRSEADIGLASAFAEYEKIVAWESALRFDTGSSELTLESKDLIDVALFTHQSNWWSARQRLGEDVPWTKTEPNVRSLEWYPIALGQSISLMHELRSKLGDETFLRLVDQFGMKHTNQQVSWNDFRQHFQKESGEAADTVFRKWLENEVLAIEHVQGKWSIYSFEAEPQKALILYGSTRNEIANREIAERLQRSMARRFNNHWLPIRSDREITDTELGQYHLLVIGEPSTHTLLRRAAAKSSVRFSSQSFRVRDQTFANSRSGVIVASENPWNPRYSVVVFAGLSTAITFELADALSPEEDLSPQVVLFPANGHSKRFVCNSAVP